uniref:Uncharacterized protein n=1 Tax=viral metagenome TaxID=1070528 RepID=A0A6C0DY08_9ZZZZ
MRKTKAKNRKRSTLAKPKLYSKRKGRGIGSSKLENTTLDAAFSDRGFSISCYNDQREAKQEYKRHLKLALAINKDLLALLDKGLTNLKKLKRNASRNIRGNASQTAEYTKDRKYTQFAYDYNIMLLNKMTSQPNIDYKGLLKTMKANPDWELGRMAPTREIWERDFA